MNGQRESTVELLLRAARRAPHAAPSRVDSASFYAFEARRERKRGLRLALALGLVSTLSIAGLCLLALRYAAPEPLRYAVASEPSAPRETLRFSDGSAVESPHESALQVTATGPHGARVSLMHGELEARIVPQPRGDWWFEAGPYRVHVTGTEFGLRWSPDARRFELRLRHGSVVVSGPMAEGGVALVAGQRLLSTLAQRHLEVGPIDAPEATASSAQPAPVAEPRDDGPGRAPSAARREPFPELSRLVSTGAFAEALALAHKRGVAELLDRGPAPELEALADAARYEGDRPLARRALLALRKRFRQRAEGRKTAYFLARISQGREAARWYERYLVEEPHGPFAAPALGALALLALELGDTTRAVRSACAYLAREPGGPYAAAARNILNQASGAAGGCAAR